jgi:hypothetical protein
MPISPLKWVVLLIRFVQSLLLTQLLYTAVLRVNGWRLLSVWVRSSISLFFSSFLTDFRKAFPLWAGPVIWSVVTPTLNGTLICGPSPHNGLSLSRQFLCNARGSNLIKRSLGRREIQFSLCIHIYTSCCCCCWMQGAAAALLYPIYKERGEHAGLCDWRHSAYNPLLSLSSEIQTRQKSIQKKKRGGGETSQLSIQLKNRSRPSKIRKSRTTILYVSLFLLSTDYIRWDDGTHMYVTEHSVPLTGRRRGRGKRRKKKGPGFSFDFLKRRDIFFFFLSSGSQFRK